MIFVDEKKKKIRKRFKEKLLEIPQLLASFHVAHHFDFSEGSEWKFEIFLIENLYTLDSILRKQGES